MHLASWVVVAGVAGIAAGITFGEACAYLSPIGYIYVGLLQAAVYPYLICSLLHGLGSLEPGKAWRLLKSGWPFFVAAWVITFACLAALGEAIPLVQPAIIGETPIPQPDTSKLLGLLIPSDFFTALSQNYVPAVVVFCIFYGVALQSLKDKTALLGVLEAIRLASLKFWNWIVVLAPVGVFALFAVTAGTTAFTDFARMGIYLALFLAGTLMLAFWVLPAIVAALAPVGYREIIRELRAALGIALVTTLSVAALPFVVEATRKLAERAGIADTDRDEVIRTNLSVAYPLGQLGNFFVYLFLLFAAYYYKAPLQAGTEAMLPLMTLLSGFGSPTSAVNAVDFLTSWLALPGGTRGLYVELQTITRYGQVVVSVMAFAFLSVLVTLAYYGKLRPQWPKLIAALVLPAMTFAAIAAAGHWAHRHVQRPVEVYYGRLTLDPTLTRGVQATVLEPGNAAGSPPASAPPAPAPSSPSAAPTIDRIQRSGTLRVGYNPTAVPFAYFNDAGDLVGHDVELAYDLARSLNVHLVFVPFAWETLERDLTTGRFDIAMSGVYATTTLLRSLSASQSYHRSPVALFMPDDRVQGFLTRDDILARKRLRLAMRADPVLQPVMAALFPGAEIVTAPDYRTLPDFAKVDAAIAPHEQAGALARANPGITAVVPKGIGDPFLLTYMMPPRSEFMVHFVNYWLELRHTDGMRARAAEYWIHGHPRTVAEPRWSIVRNVLGWGK